MKSKKLQLEKRVMSSLLLVGSAFVDAGTHETAGSQHSDKPNILFILADDMGLGDFGSGGGGPSRTPVLDKLAQKGTVLTHHYSGAPICSPSRACLLTGRYPQRTGVLDTQGVYNLHNLSLDERTIANVLNDSGYITGLIGKWHLGKSAPEYYPWNRGFSKVVVTDKNHHWNWILNRNGVQEKSDGRYLADVLNDEAVQFIRTNKDEPFFLYLAHFTPHDPLLAIEEDIAHFRAAGFNEKVSTLYAMIYRMDQGIGRVLNELKVQGLDENTLVVFASDNGPQYAVNWIDRTGVTRFNCGLRGHKDLVFDGGVRVPALLYWPGGGLKGGTIDESTHFTDWFPTLLAAAGVPVPQDNPPLDGRNILPMLRGETEDMPATFCWQFSRYYPSEFYNIAIREGGWKLIRPVDGDGVDGPVLGVLPPKGIAKTDVQIDPARRYVPEIPGRGKVQLFNLKDDPFEQNDLAAQNPEKVMEMEKQLHSWFSSVMTDCTNRLSHFDF